MDFMAYRDRRLQEDPEFAEAYEEEKYRREISRQVLRLRRRRGWTQAELAEALNTKQPAVARLESGSYRPSLATLESICEAMGARLEIRLIPEEG